MLITSTRSSMTELFFFHKPPSVQHPKVAISSVIVLFDGGKEAATVQNNEVNSIPVFHTNDGQGEGASSPPEHGPDTRPVLIRMLGHLQTKQDSDNQ